MSPKPQNPDIKILDVVCTGKELHTKRVLGKLVYYPKRGLKFQAQHWGGKQGVHFGGRVETNGTFSFNCPSCQAHPELKGERMELIFWAWIGDGRRELDASKLG